MSVKIDILFKTEHKSQSESQFLGKAASIGSYAHNMIFTNRSIIIWFIADQMTTLNKIDRSMTPF